MWNEPLQKQLDEIPMLYATDFIRPEHKIIYQHFFIGDCDWYIAEFDGDDTFFGFTILNNDYQNAEWGYISYSDLKSVRLGYVEVDNDLYWEPKRTNEIEKIRKCLNND